MAGTSLLVPRQADDDCLYMTPLAEGPYTLQNGENDPFPAFPAFSGFLRNSGGPSLPLEPFWPEWPELPEYASLRLLTLLGTLGTLATLVARVAPRPYSWPPESARTGRFWLWPDSRRPYCSLCRK